ncbi:MAG: TetR/AcrR family transcriptional regulator [Thalassolituus oleivorans]|uniref:TetR/AcrR family transcriptional regulator n=1 Tax=Thalassolituus oleivorans TaxID=187493 RepID=UPI001B423CE1|nr:TetR/AcrR family transcriptional regulator [Thalassolituus oleivorans]MBQ0728484.1 TetR/AcrR family transcriptional regulator [Thalassolituus oleivorans]MBQ0781331.1 TetR/AcrR family transcriptional regulator [Thalassolituus oleivorans]MDF1640640.1 TetR/AcrR family transcriptional regulator [Thalassolituus oleivorans]
MPIKPKPVATKDSKTPAKPTVTRGHKKKARTQKALIEAAMRIYARKGVGELLLNELAEEAKVSNGTVYNYFKSREEVLEAVGIELATEFSHHITAASTGVESGAERMSIGVRMFIERAKREPEWASAVVRIYQYDKNLRSAVIAYVRADVRQGMKQNTLKFNNEDLAVVMVMFATVGAMVAVLDGIEIENIDSLLSEMLLLGLGANPENAKSIANLALPPKAVEPAQTEETSEKKVRAPRRVTSRA